MPEDADPIASNGDNGIPLELIGEAGKHDSHELDPGRCWHIRQPHQPGMRSTVQVDQVSEIGVDCDNDPRLRLGAVEQRAVARIRTDGAGIQDIVALLYKPNNQSTTRASVDEEPHDVLGDTETGSSESRAITARAYAAQAWMSSGSRSG